MQYTGPTTTAESNGDERMKVSTGCSHGKAKCLKCAMKKDGAGGPGKTVSPVGYGKKSPSLAFPKLSSLKMPGIKGLKIKSLKTLKVPKIGKATGSSKFGKALVSSTKSKGLKGMLKNLI